MLHMQAKRRRLMAPVVPITELEESSVRPPRGIVGSVPEHAKTTRIPDGSWCSRRPADRPSCEVMEPGPIARAPSAFALTAWTVIALRKGVPDDIVGARPGDLAVGGRPRGELRAVSRAVERRRLLLSSLDRVLVRAAIGGLPSRERARARDRTEGRSVQLGSQELLQQLHPRLVERRPLRPGALLGDVAPEATHELAEHVDIFPAQCGVGDTREGVPERRAAEPGDVRELRVRRPEALGARHALARVLEHTCHRVAVLQRIRGGLCVEVTDARTATSSCDGAVVRRVRVARSPDAREHPAEWHQLLDVVAPGVQRLAVLLPSGQAEVAIPGPRRIEGEARAAIRRLDDLLDNDRAG